MAQATPGSCPCQVRHAGTVNAVTFVHSDRTALSLPLAYVAGRLAQITYGINVENAADMVGSAPHPSIACRPTQRAPAA